jgi:hypothetical protein
MSSEIINMQTREEHIGQSLLSKDNFTHYMKVAESLSKSSMVPKGMQGKPADILIAMEMGLQIGIPMMQAIQDIAVINGKPCMYGDGLLAVVQGHKDFEWIKEEILEHSGDKKSAVCVIKRKNHEPHTVTFSVGSAKQAQLWDRQGPWKQYPERMLQMRARGFCIRDTFSDALRGIKTEEEVLDYSDPPKDNKVLNKSKSLMDKLKSAKGQIIEMEPTVEADNLANPEQLKEVHALMAVKVFDPERLKSALEHYKVDTLGQLSEIQADDFISKLNRLADKE